MDHNKVTIETELKTDFSMHYTYRYSAYRAVNTLLLGYKKQSVIAVLLRSMRKT
jgi:hypothetical protein